MFTREHLIIGAAGFVLGGGHLQICHPGQLFELDALERVDVGFALAAGGDGQGELAGAVPLHGALVAEHAQHVAEERHALEGVVTGAHGGSVRRPAVAATRARTAPEPGAGRSAGELLAVGGKTAGGGVRCGAGMLTG